MRVSAAFLSISFVIFCPGSAAPRQVPPIQRDEQAIATIQAAIDAMGGSKAIAQVQTAVVQGSLAFVSGTSAPSGTFVMLDQFTAQGHEFKDSFLSASTKQTLVSGHGTPGFAANGSVRQLTPAVTDSRLAVHIPAITLASILANAGYSITSVGTATLNGQTAIRIHMHIDSDLVQQTLSVQDWYFDASSGLPLRVEYRVPDTDSVLNFSSVAAQLSDFRVVQGITTPFHIAASLDGKPHSVLSVSSVSYNKSVLSSDFDLPVGGAQ